MLTKNLFSDIAPTMSDERELVKMFREKGALDVLKYALKSTATEQNVAIKRAIAKLPSYLQNSPDAILLMNDFAVALGWEINSILTPPTLVPLETQYMPTTQYEVILHNDDVTTMDFVVEMLTNVFHKNSTEAHALMMAVHETGQSVAGVYTYDKAVSIKNQIEQQAADKKFPLQLSIKKLGHEGDIKIVTEQKEVVTPVVGSIYRFGKYSWRVLDVQNGKALLISSVIIEKKAFHSAGGSIAWEQCDLRSHLNGAFYNSFEQDKTRIIMKATSDRIFLLNIDEAKMYFSNDKDRIASFDGEKCGWWLRSCGAWDYTVANITSAGFVGSGGQSTSYDNLGVRPALWINLLM